MKCPWPTLRPFRLSPAVALAASLVACHAADFYVATTGSDSNLGTIAQPFATLEAARNAVRALNQQGPVPPGAINVWLRGGRYMRQSPFTLSGSQDSGTPTSPIVYQAYAGETPVIIGGMSVTGFQSVTDPAILARLTSAAQTNVLVANLTAQGITNIIPLARHGMGLWWSWTGQNELFFQDQPMQLARWPSSNWLTIATSPSPGTNYFAYSGNNPSTWASLSDVWVDGYWDYDWADECDQVSSIDTTNHIVYIASPASQFGYAADQRFYFLNVLEELDSPGEYYIDRVHGLLYFWPPASIGNGNPFISTVGQGGGGEQIYPGQALVFLNSVSNVALSTITFEGAVGSLICIYQGTSNLVRNCVLNGSSCDGVDLILPTNTGVCYCNISNMGEIGVFMCSNGSDADRLTLTPDGNFATCNTIYNMSRLCWTYNPGINIQGVANYVAHNLISNGRHNALLLYGNNHVIEYNEIRNVCTETADAGAIYMGRDWTMRGNILRYNYVHDINAGGGAANPSGVWGVYLDDFCSGTTVFGNIFCSVDGGVVIGGGRDNIVRNNIFVGCTNCGIYADQRGLSWSATYITNTNSALWTELNAMPYQVPPWSIQYPALVSIATNNPGAALGNVIQQNISYSNGTWLQLYDDAASVVNVTNNFANGNPQFVNYAQRNFTLSTNSPLWVLGFQPIPMNRFGPVPPRPSGLRVLGPP